MKSNDTDKLLKIFLDKNFPVDNDGLEESVKEVVKYYHQNTRHQYHVVSRYIYEKIGENDDTISYVLNNITEMQFYVKYNQEKCDEIVQGIVEANEELNTDMIKLNLEKLYDHISLEEERAKIYLKRISNSSSLIENKVMNRFQVVIKEFQENVEQISNSLNANIITIVGLFSAIIFVFFGGVVCLSTVFEGIFSLDTKEELVIPVIGVLIVGLVLYNIIFLLLYSISKMVNKNIGREVMRAKTNIYKIEEHDKECFKVIDIKNKCQKCFPDRKKAEKYEQRKQLISNMKARIIDLFSTIFLRYPYVTIINGALITTILVLYFNI